MAKIWIISDTHFGVKNNSKRWEDLMQGWMDKFFFPLLDNEVEDGDVFVHCGDIFDNRQSVGLSTMNICIGFFERLSKYFKEMYLLCGNHDAYYTTKNDITSLECLKHIPGVNVIKTPLVKTVLGKTMCFIPWTEDTRVFEKIAGIDTKPDVLFCHAEFNGCIMNSYGSKSENELGVPDVSKIYSGHIHHKHKHCNATYVGSPYQLTQNDRNNNKCVWTFDPETLEEHVYFNTYSPEFIRVKYESISDMTFGEFKKMCENRFVEIETDYKLMSKCRFQKLISLVNDNYDIKDLSFYPTKKDENENQDINISDCMSITEMLDKYIDEMVVCDPATKKSVRTIAKKLIHE